LNFYLGRDHTAKRLGIKPPETKMTEKPEREITQTVKEPPKVN
jgi:hypothetical protein